MASLFIWLIDFSAVIDVHCELEHGNPSPCFTSNLKGSKYKYLYTIRQPKQIVPARLIYNTGFGKLHPKSAEQEPQIT